MGLWTIIDETVATNIGMSIEYVLVILLTLGAMLFMAKNFKLGVMLLFFTSGVMFIVVFGANQYYSAGMNYAPFLAIFFISLVIMVFTVYSASRSAQEGSII